MVEWAAKGSSRPNSPPSLPPLQPMLRSATIPAMTRILPPLVLCAAAGLAVAGGPPASPTEAAARLEARMAAGEGVLLPDADAELVRHAGTIDLAEGDWPAAFHARAGGTICVAVSPLTGDYGFFDESGECFFTLVPVLPTTENWVAPFRRAEEGSFPDDDLYAPWRLVDVWSLSHAESAEYVSHAESAENAASLVTRHSSLVTRGAARPATNLSFTAFSFTETNLLFVAAWPTNEALPDATLDLYGSTNLLDPRWLFLSSHPATNPPVPFSVDPATLPWYVEPTQHVHDATCVSITNVVLSPLDGTTVYTNALWSCETNRAPGACGFFRLGTHCDSDGDGLPDARETLVAGTDPASPDTDGDGVPDDLTAEEWLSHPLWAHNGDCTNLVIFLYEPITNGVAALRFDDLCIPLATNAGPWCLCIPTNAVVDCRLVAEPGVVVMLWYGPPEAAVPTRSLVPGWSVPASVAVPIWCDAPMAVFGGNDWGGGSCRFARPTLRVRTGEPGQDGGLGVCVHAPDGIARFTWSVEPAVCTGLVAVGTGAVETDESGPGLSIDVSDAVPGPAGTRGGVLSVHSWQQPFFGTPVLWGELSEAVSAHLCERWSDGLAFCLSCGGFHRPPASPSCRHAAWCATKSSLETNCDCARPFVRIGGEGSFVLAADDGACCPVHAGASNPATLLQAPQGLGASVANGVLGVAPEARSPTIGGFVARYRILDGDGGVYRDLSLPFTCADLGVDPCLSDAQVPYEWEEAGPDAYYLQDGTFYVARRADPYPVRLWNESPSDARLVFAFASPTNGPGLFDPSLGTRHSSLVTTNAAPFAALNDDRTVYLDALCSNVLATLSLTLSDPIADRTFLSESLAVKVVDTAVGEHWRVRSATDTISWDFSDAPEDVYAYLWRPNADSIFGDLVGFKLGKTPSLSLDLPPGDYLLDFYFPRVYDGGSWAAWSTNYLHIVHTEVTPLENLRFTNATERACFALTNNNGQAANWTISPVVAGGPTLFSSKTGGAGSAARLDNATSVWVRAGTMPGNYTITATHPHCPASTTNATFTVGRIDVESLLFNWDTTSSTNDAINLRWNYKDEINLATGEWTRAGYRAPACYVTNAWPIVRATFSAAPADLSSVTLLAETDAAIGGFAATNVAFAAGAASDVALSTQSTTTNCILKESFDLTWKAVVSNGTEVVTNTLGRTDGHVFYTILDKPKLPWTDSEIANTNVWVSALEFVTKTNACFGETTQHGAISNLTRCLFQDCHFTYDTTSGNPHFFDSTNRAFQMSDYVSAANTTTDKTVNCFDQAHGLSFLSALCGIPAEIVRMEPFGYLNPGHLVGVSGLCNNPFYSSPRSTSTNPSCGTNDTSRSKFSCHFFVRHNSSIFDSCAGPALGTETLSEYVSRMVDTSTSDERFYEIPYRDIYGFVHKKTVEGGVATNAVPYTDIKTIE